MTIYIASVDYVTVDDKKKIQTQDIVLEARNADEAVNQVITGLLDEGKYVRGQMLCRKLSMKKAKELLNSDARFWTTI